MASGARIEDGGILQGPKFGALYEGIQGNGVISGYEVIQSGTGALTVNVSGGSAIVGGNIVTQSGMTYLTHGAADATYPRYDNIAISGDGTPFIQTGTAGSIPKAPDGINATIPSSINFIGSQATTVLNGDITESRGFVKQQNLETFVVSVDFNGSMPFASTIENLFYGIRTDTIDNCDAITGWTDSADMTVSINNTSLLYDTIGLNLIKDGTSSVDASTSKTVTSTDFADSEDDLNIGILIKDQATMDKLTTSDSVLIRFGSDSSNYYQWNWNKADLIVGANALCCMVVANADSTVGTPDTANMDFAFIQYTTNNTSDTTIAGDIVMDEWHVTNGGIVNYTSNNAGDIIIDSDFSWTSTAGGDQLSSAFYINGVLQLDSRRVSATAAANSETLVNMTYLKSGIAKSSNNIIKVMFLGDSTSNTLPDNVSGSGTRQGTNQLSVRELSVSKT